MTGFLRSLAVALVALAGLLGLVEPADAHRLKVFATVEDGAVVGYAFFVGGGRPGDVAFVIRDAAGRERHRGHTDDTGNFRWRPETAADLVVAVDSGDGHVAEARLEASLFAANTAVPSNSASPPSAPSPLAAAPPASTATATVDPTHLERQIEAAVDRAVERRTRPLLEAYSQAEARVRFNDVMGGIGMIVGLIGAALWGASRRRAGRARHGETETS